MIAVLIVTFIGLLLAVLLVIAAKFMAVEKNETEEAIRGFLPGANCGACGYAGCDGYAEKLASGEETNPGKCVPGGNNAMKSISELLGLSSVSIEEQKAIVRCCGTADTSVYVMQYNGPMTCEACNSFYQGRKSCSYGCLGFGDCATKCKFNAIRILNGLAYVDRDNCTGCGSCVSACPNQLIVRIPAKNHVYVACNSLDKGAFKRQICISGCIGCMRCQKTCSLGAIVVENNLAHVNYDLCVGCGKCVDVCPTKVLKMV